MILDIIRIILGLLTVMFLPGYLLSLILLKKLSLAERLCLAIGLSIFIVVFLGFFLTLVSYLSKTKGISIFGVWLSLIIICLLLIIALLILHRQHNKKQLSQKIENEK